MTPRIITADEARALLSALSKAKEFAGAGRSIEAIIEHRAAVDAINTAAPDLVETVIAQTAEIERLTALAETQSDQISGLCDDADHLREELDEAATTIKRQGTVAVIATEEINRLRAVVAGDPTPRMIRTEDVARALWPFVYAGRRDACDDEGFGPSFGDLAQTTQDLFCALIDEAMQTMGAAIKRDPAEEDRRAVAAAWMFDAFAARGKRITELAAERDTLRAEVAAWRDRPDGVQASQMLDIARNDAAALRAAAAEYLAACKAYDIADTTREAETWARRDAAYKALVALIGGAL